MVGVLAILEAHGLFSKLVMVRPSPRYIDDEGYVGGISAAQIEELLEFLPSNDLGWSAAMAPAIMGNPELPELGETLTESFCATDRQIAAEFAGVTFFSDNRADVPLVDVRTLVRQCREDIMAPERAGEWVHANLPNSECVCCLTLRDAAPTSAHPSK